MEFCLRFGILPWDKSVELYKKVYGEAYKGVEGKPRRASVPSHRVAVAPRRYARPKSCAPKISRSVPGKLLRPALLVAVAVVVATIVVVARRRSSLAFPQRGHRRPRPSRRQRPRRPRRRAPRPSRPRAKSASRRRPQATTRSGTRAWRTAACGKARARVGTRRSLLLMSDPKEVRTGSAQGFVSACARPGCTISRAAP